ncbi:MULTISPECIES: TauD/TfdA family dioxygenase [unclassified Blastococcus]
MTGRTVAPDSHDLSTTEIATLLELAAGVTADPGADPAGFTAQAARAARRVPESLWEVLHCFDLYGSASGILVLRGLPVRDVPPTPADNGSHVGATTEAARVQAVVNSCLGHMIGYEAEAGGRLFQDMVPSPAMADTQTSQSSRVVLEAHTEQSFSALGPDVVSLMCLRGDPAAATYVFPATDLLPHLSAAQEELLRRPLWTFAVDQSFRLRGDAFVEGDVRGPFPVLAGPAEDPTFLFDQDLQRGTTPEAQALLEEVIDLYCAHRRSHVLEPGDLLLLDNHRAIHGRSAFRPTYDGTQRFVVRSFVVRDLFRSHAARPAGGRIVPARYS